MISAVVRGVWDLWGKQLLLHSKSDVCICRTDTSPRTGLSVNSNDVVSVVKTGGLTGRRDKLHKLND
jgi:hypothetical protein